MKILSLRFLIVPMLLFALSPPTQRAGETGRQPEKNGTLVVRVTFGDDDNTPANDVYIEARGFVREYNSEKSFVLKSSTPGRYEVSVPPGVYDVFVMQAYAGS